MGGYDGKLGWLSSYLCFVGNCAIFGKAYIAGYVYLVLIALRSSLVGHVAIVAHVALCCLCVFWPSVWCRTADHIHTLTSMALASGVIQE